ncbi:MAG: GIY-YIG nuclease family protein [Acidiferrobacterales bacterium]|jgi:Uri superfamily endonuclease|nr:GIY-YIG nuclease family protein [Acidiferrobacterales bacterium]
MSTSELPVPLSGAPLSEARTYQLHIHLEHGQNLEIGRLGRFSFEKGDYLYTGSATRNMERRLLRHLSGHKTLHWHIDYLLAADSAEIIAISLAAEAECYVNQSVIARIPVRGFGASDCRAGCGSHLKFLGQL